MARYFNVKVSAGTDQGPYTVYHTSETPGNEATLYPGGGAAINISINDLTSPLGVDVQVPDEATKVILFNTNLLVIEACPSNTITLNLILEPTATPNPTETVAPTPSPSPSPTFGPTPEPTATQIPTPTPSPTPEATATPAPTATPNPTVTPNPTPTPSSTAIPEPDGYCQFVFVSNEVVTTGYGLAYNFGGPVQVLFSNLLATTNVTYGGLTGDVYSVCSISAPSYWEQSTNTLLAYPNGVILLDAGDPCTQNIDCVYEGNVKGGDPVATPFPTATVTTVACNEYEINYPASQGDPNGSVTYDDCDGIRQTLTIIPDSAGSICAQNIISWSLIQEPTLIGSCVGETLITPNPTPTPTATTGGKVVTNEYSTFYVTSAQLDPAEFCVTNYTATLTLKSTANTISLLLGEMVYDSNLDPFIGFNGRYYYISETLGSGSQTANPRQYVMISSTGIVEDVGVMDCSGNTNPY